MQQIQQPCQKVKYINTAHVIFAQQIFKTSDVPVGISTGFFGMKLMKPKRTTPKTIVANGFASIYPPTLTRPSEYKRHCVSYILDSGQSFF